MHNQNVPNTGIRNSIRTTELEKKKIGAKKQSSTLAAAAACDYTARTKGGRTTFNISLFRGKEIYGGRIRRPFRLEIRTRKSQGYRDRAAAMIPSQNASIILAEYTLYTGCPICLWTWVGLALIWVFHHLPGLPSHFFQIPICPGSGTLTIQANPVLEQMGHPVHS